MEDKRRSRRNRYLISRLAIFLLFSLSILPLIGSGQQPVTNLQQILQAPAGEKVVVEGSVYAYTTPWTETAPYMITLTDGKQTLPVVFWKDIEQYIPGNARKVGAKIRVTGEVNVYRGKKQIKLEAPLGKVEFLGMDNGKSEKAMPGKGGVIDSAAEAFISNLNRSRVPIGSIDRNNLGQIVTIAGEVVEFQKSNHERVPNTITLDDGSGRVSVVYWVKVANDIKQAPNIGDKIQVTGESQVYRDVLQIQIRNANLFKFLDANTNVRVSAQESGTAPSPPQVKPAQSNSKPIYTKGPNSASTRWEREYAPAAQRAQQNNRPMIIYFRRDGLQKCLDIETSILMSDAFNSLAHNFECVFEDVKYGPLLAYHYNVIRVPHFEILNPNGESIARLYNNITRDDLLASLQKALNNR